MSEIKDYGEPWYVEEYFWDDEKLYHIVQTGAREIVPNDDEIHNQTRERICACVNALRGMDPDKLHGLVEAVENTLDMANQSHTTNIELLGKLQAALNALMGYGEGK